MPACSESWMWLHCCGQPVRRAVCAVQYHIRFTICRCAACSGILLGSWSHFSHPPTLTPLEYTVHGIGVHVRLAMLINCTLYETARSSQQVKHTIAVCGHLDRARSVVGRSSERCTVTAQQSVLLSGVCPEPISIFHWTAWTPRFS